MKEYMVTTMVTTDEQTSYYETVKEAEVAAGELAKHNIGVTFHVCKILKSYKAKVVVDEEL